MDRVLDMIAGKEWEGFALEKMLIRQFCLTRRQISGLKFLPGALLVNGERSRVSRILREGDRVQVTLHTDGRETEPDTIRKVRPETEQNPEILWSDDDFLVVNKPAGIAVHPAHGHREDTLLFMLENSYMLHGHHNSKLYPAGRLDKDTSGLMAFAKHSVAAAWLQRKGVAEKEYIALVCGCFPPEQKVFTVDYPIRKMRGHLNRMETVRKEMMEDADTDREMESPAEPCAEHKKPLRAVTHGEVIQQMAGMAVVRLRLETGRTHQIRVHMAAMGHPLLGDPIYGPEAGGRTAPGSCGDGNDAEAKPAGSRTGAASGRISRAALHCAFLVLKHPITGETLSFTCPLPDDMQAEIQAAALLMKKCDNENRPR